MDEMRTSKEKLKMTNVGRKFLEEADEHTVEVLQRVAVVTNTNLRKVATAAAEMLQAFSEAAEPAAKTVGYITAELSDVPRPPVEIKKDIKHQRNQMRVRQLNKELNESYKAYKKK